MYTYIHIYAHLFYELLSIRATIGGRMCARASVMGIPFKQSADTHYRPHIYIRICGCQYSAAENTHLLVRGSKLIAFHSQLIEQAVNRTRMKLQKILLVEGGTGEERHCHFWVRRHTPPFTCVCIYLKYKHLRNVFPVKVDNS